MGTRTRPTLIHRGFLYAQKRVETPGSVLSPSENRMAHAKTWRAGFLAAEVEQRRRAKAQKHKS